MRKTIISALISAGILLTPLAAEAVGLGKLTVKSGLGQPFNGEIDLLSVERNEEGTMTARLASTDIFQQAKIDRNLALSSLRFAVEQKKTGEWVVKVSSQQPINDPFLDLLVEVNWPSGRLLREYTVLLDPPSTANEQQQIAAVELPALKQAPARTEAEPEKAVMPALQMEKSLRPKKTTKPAAAKPEPMPAKEPEAAGDVYGPVKPGDTLGKIAAAIKPEGVSMEQMLVSLYRTNQQAFSGANMNRLKTGQILHIPENSQVTALEKPEAVKEVRAHAADWNAYRQKLASAVESGRPTHEDEGRKSSSGKITAAVEDKAAPKKEPSKDVLKLSKSESVGTAKGATHQEDNIAQDKAIKEANQRIGELEKNIQDMRKLLELRNQGGADLQKQAAKQPAPAKQQEEKKADVKPPVAEKKPEPKAEAEKPVEEKPATPAVPASGVTVASDEEPKPKPKPKVVTLQPKPPVTPEPSFLDELLGNPLVLGGAALVALLGGLFGARKLKARREQGPSDAKKGSRVPVPYDETPPNTSPLADLTPAVSSVLTDFTQSGMGAIDTTDVDPIAEAEVYMAYGRDVQAEEILREAMARDPQRHEIHLKLLEIYAGRKDMGSYEALARQLYASTGGSPDPDWEKAAEMGRAFDPANSLYVAVEVEAPVADIGSDMLDLDSSGETVDASPDLDFNLESADAGAAPAEAAPEEEKLDELAPDLDFNLGQPGEAVALQPEPEAQPAEENLLDFNLDMPAETAPAEEAPVEQANLVDFDLGDSAPAATEAPPQSFEADETMLSFDLDMPLSSEPEAPAAEPEVPPASEIALPDEEPTPEPLDISAESWQSQTSEIAELDFPLDKGETAAPVTAFEAPAEPAPFAELEIPAEQAPAETPPVTEEMVADDAMLDLSALMEEEPVAPVEEAKPEESEPESILITPPPMSDEAMLDFDFNVGEESSAPPEGQAAPNIDLSDISLDLDGEAKPPATQADDSARFQEAATKLDLAKAYMEMGDKEGAKEILGEVLNEGSDDQQDEAKKLLADLR